MKDLGLQTLTREPLRTEKEGLAAYSTLTFPRYIGTGHLDGEAGSLQSLTSQGIVEF